MTKKLNVAQHLFLNASPKNLVMDHLRIHSLRNKFESLKSIISPICDKFLVLKTKIHESYISKQNLNLHWNLQILEWFVSTNNERSVSIEWVPLQAKKSKKFLLKIAMVPNVSKIFETCIFRQLYNFVPEFLSKYQQGFPKGYST